MIQTNTSIKRNVTRLKKYLKKNDLYRKLPDNENQSVDLNPGDVIYFKIDSYKKKSPWLLLTDYHSGGDVTFYGSTRQDIPTAKNHQFSQQKPPYILIDAP